MRYRARAPLRLLLGGDWTDLEDFQRTEGSAALTIAIAPHAEGQLARPDATGFLGRLRSHRTYVSYTTDLPSDADLAADSAGLLVWLALVKTAVSNTADRRRVAAEACDIAKFLGIVGGRHDVFASALGGMRSLEFRDAFETDEIVLPPTTQQIFRDSLVLGYSGNGGRSARSDIARRLAADDRAVIAGLTELKSLAGGMELALRDRDFDRLAGLLSEHAAVQYRIAGDAYMQSAANVAEIGLRAGALAAKPQADGGTVLFMNRGDGRLVREALQRARVSTIDFDFDTYGVYVRKG